MSTKAINNTYIIDKIITDMNTYCVHVCLVFRNSVINVGTSKNATDNIQILSSME